MKLVRNAMYALESNGKFHLFHVAGNGHIQIAMYRDERGTCCESFSGQVSMIHCMITEESTRSCNHDHWIDYIEERGVLVASHVVNPVKLTSRDYRKMARKAAKQH